jgi:molybdopterin/thiamine biosynthesis adenylyltransferase
MAASYIFPMDLDFTEDEIVRYSRHILLAEVGGLGQARLKAARVLVIGAGGLGSPLILYLAAAGVGTIGVIDDDAVELSNLQRQIAHATARLGMKKVDSAAAAAPCYRCLYPEAPPDGLVPSCGEAGVLGAVTGVMGTLQATEVLKEILAIGETLSGRLLIWDALATRFRTVRLRRDPHCALCGPSPTITDLSCHAVPSGPSCAV